MALESKEPKSALRAKYDENWLLKEPSDISVWVAQRIRALTLDVYSENMEEESFLFLISPLPSSLLLIHFTTFVWCEKFVKTGDWLANSNALDCHFPLTTTTVQQQHSTVHTPFPKGCEERKWLLHAINFAMKRRKKKGNEELDYYFFLAANWVFLEM